MGESAGFGLVLSLANQVTSADAVPVKGVGCRDAPNAFWPSPLSIGEIVLESIMTVRCTASRAPAGKRTSMSPLLSKDRAGPVP